MYLRNKLLAYPHLYTNIGVFLPKTLGCLQGGQKIQVPKGSGSIKIDAIGPAFEGAEMKYVMRDTPGAIEKIEIDKDTKEPRFKVIGREEWNTELTDSLLPLPGLPVRLLTPSITLNNS